MSQKICVISFDHWNYDHHIVSELRKLGHESNHIKIGGFKHKNILQRVKNTFSKIFLGKNPKLKKRQDFIIESLKKIGKQDQILVINPEIIEKKYHLEIKKYTDKYIAYLYDSVARNPVEHLLNGIFDSIYSFDANDVQKYGFLPTSNYIYFDKVQDVNSKQDFIYIGSIDDRIDVLEQIGNELKTKNYSFQFFAIGKKAFKYDLVNFFSRKYKNIQFQKRKFNQEETLKIYNESNCIVDLVREHQHGLSFRIFEAIGLNKKILTNNKNVTKYDFFESKNILLFEENWINRFNQLNQETSYSGKIQEKYQLKSWIKNVFNLV